MNAVTDYDPNGLYTISNMPADADRWAAVWVSPPSPDGEAVHVDRLHFFARGRKRSLCGRVPFIEIVRHEDWVARQSRETRTHLQTHPRQRVHCVHCRNRLLRVVP